MFLIKCFLCIRRFSKNVLNIRNDVNHHSTKTKYIYLGISKLHQGYQYTNPYTKTCMLFYLIFDQYFTQSFNYDAKLKKIVQIYHRHNSFFIVSQKFREIKESRWFFVQQKIRRIKECFQLFFALGKFREIKEFFKN